MGDQHNDESQATNDRLQEYAENTQQEDDGQPKSVDNGVSAGEATEDVDAAAAASEHEEDNVGSSPPLASDVHMIDHHSSDDESSRSTDTQQRASDEEKAETNSEAGQQEHLKQISNRIFQMYIDKIN